MMNDHRIRYCEERPEKALDRFVLANNRFQPVAFGTESVYSSFHIYRILYQMYTVNR